MSASACRMAGIRRMIVGLKRESNDIVPAKFVDCIVKYFAPSEISTRVSCEITDDMLVLSSAEDVATGTLINDKESSGHTNPSLSSVVLQHSPECPLKLLGEEEVMQLADKFQSQGVYVGVAVILESLDHKILLTQRADHMRAFPRVWVPPGGHIECGENLPQGAFRELEEETGLKYGCKESQYKLLCLWESVYPVLLGFGIPKNHHIVAYYYLQANESWEGLQSRIELDPEEVQACTWLDEQSVEYLFERKDDLRKVDSFCILPDGNMKRTELELGSMFPSVLWQEKRIYSGTQLALHHWLKLCKSRSESQYTSKI